MFRSWQRRLVLLSAGAVLLIVLAEPARAWNDAGHMAVARIAWLRLTEPQRQAVFTRLKAHPHFESSLIYKRPENATDAEWAFLRASTWSDYIRPPKSYSKEKVAEHAKYRFHRGVWHYVNFPYHAGQKESELPREALPNETNIVAQIEQSLDVLRGKTKRDPGAVAGLSSEANDAVRICWLFHLVGDLHQPMHAVALVDQKLFPEGDHGDQGGNLLAIRRSESDKPMRLHACWDGMLSSDSRFDAVCQLADELTHDPLLTPEKFPELVQHRQVRDWAAESYLLAKTHVYRDGQFPQVRWEDVESRKVPADKVPALSEQQAAQSHQLARRRIALAGYRLAEALKTLSRD
ncbi:MAG: S1/P1 nuclease [Planctomycetaceae bacterium]|nr:S1/P1 nuclease [Planctomycetaceae bacterium]